jgi:putative redox protein
MITAASNPTNYTTVFTDGTHTSISDTTLNNGGAGQGFRPHDLLEAAIATCINIAVRTCATREGMPLSGVVTRVSLDRSEPDEAVFHHEVELQGELTEEQRRRLLRVANACPVRRTLMRTIRFEDGQIA